MKTAACLFIFALIACSCGKNANSQPGLSSLITKKRIVTFTKRAIEKVRTLQTSKGGTYVRVTVVNEGPTGFSYDIQLDDFVNPAKDYLWEQEGVMILVDQDSSPYVLNAIIDWRVEAGGREGFYFENPNAIK